LIFGGEAVGLYCAVVVRFELLVSVSPTAAHQAQVVFNQRAGKLCAWLREVNLGSGEAAAGSRSISPTAKLPPRNRTEG
jgi:hypothetical protein